MWSLVYMPLRFPQTKKPIMLYVLRHTTSPLAHICAATTWCTRVSQNILCTQRSMETHIQRLICLFDSDCRWLMALVERRPLCFQPQHRQEESHIDAFKFITASSVTHHVYVLPPFQWLRCINSASVDLLPTILCQLFQIFFLLIFHFRNSYGFL